jgi:predicted nucleic acid-binding protein
LNVGSSASNSVAVILVKLNNCEAFFRTLSYFILQIFLQNYVKERIIQLLNINSNNSSIIALSDTIVDKCIEIRRNGKIKTPDAIIAATAIVHNFTLLTSDSDFNRIPNLKTLNPFDL